MYAISSFFLFNCGIPLSNKACCVDELSRESILGYSNLTTFVVDWTVSCKTESCVLLVFLCLQPKWMTLAATGAIQHSHSSNSSIQWLRVKHQMCAIGRCTLYFIAILPWSKKRSAIYMYLLESSIQLSPHNH